MVQVGDLVEVCDLMTSDKAVGVIDGATYEVKDLVGEGVVIETDGGVHVWMAERQYTVVNEPPLEAVEGSEQVINTFMDVQDDEGEVFNGVDQNWQKMTKREYDFPARETDETFEIAAHDYHYTNQEPEDMVNHPKHYTAGGMETIDKMEFFYGTKALKIYCTINAYKYDARAGIKGDAKEDGEKATWYINKAIELQEKLDTGNGVLGSLDYLLD